MSAQSVGFAICFAIASLGRDLIRIVKRRRIADAVDREERAELAHQRRMAALEERAAVIRSLRRISGNPDAIYDELEIDPREYEHPAPAEAVAE